MTYDLVAAFSKDLWNLLIYLIFILFYEAIGLILYISSKMLNDELICSLSEVFWSWVELAIGQNVVHFLYQGVSISVNHAHFIQDLENTLLRLTLNQVDTPHVIYKLDVFPFNLFFSVLFLLKCKHMHVELILQFFVRKVDH